MSWAPQRGQATALVGLNGAGKSTLMRIMTGLVAPTSGSLAVATNQDGRSVPAIIESPALFGGLTVRRNLEIHRVLTGAYPRDLRLVAEMVQIESVWDQRAGTLSQGYRQRVAIAVALLGFPDSLLLDEPTAALDPEAVTHLRRLIRQVADSGTAVVVSSHQLRELEGTADALTLLHEGRVLYDGRFGSFVGPTWLRIRAPSDEATCRLARCLLALPVSAVFRGAVWQAVTHQDEVTSVRVFTGVVAAGSLIGAMLGFVAMVAVHRSRETPPRATTSS